MHSQNIFKISLYPFNPVCGSGKTPWTPTQIAKLFYSDLCSSVHKPLRFLSLRCCVFRTEPNPLNQPHLVILQLLKAGNSPSQQRGLQFVYRMDGIVYLSRLWLFQSSIFPFSDLIYFVHLLWDLISPFHNELLPKSDLQTKNLHESIQYKILKLKSNQNMKNNNKHKYLKDWPSLKNAPKQLHLHLTSKKTIRDEAWQASTGREFQRRGRPLKNPCDGCSPA